MGYVTDRFLIVSSSYDNESIKLARKKAVAVFGKDLVGPVMNGTINDSTGFIVWTSGSKTGWSDDDGHQKNITILIEEMRQMDRPPNWIRVDTLTQLADDGRKRVEAAANATASTISIEIRHTFKSLGETVTVVGRLHAGEWRWSVQDGDRSRDIRFVDIPSGEILMILDAIKKVTNLPFDRTVTP
jgi:hypothetical protein